MKRAISKPFQTKGYDYLGNFHVTIKKQIIDT